MYCPNPDCPSLRELGAVAEFQEDVLKCSDCGTALLPGEPPPAPEPRDPPSIPEEPAPLPESMPAETVGTFETPAQEAMARLALEAAGIQVLPWRGYGIRVSKDQAALAREILERDLSTDREIFGEDADSPREPERCPRCGSASFSQHDFSWLKKLAVVFFGDSSRGMCAARCDSCGHVWRFVSS